MFLSYMLFTVELIPILLGPVKKLREKPHNNAKRNNNSLLRPFVCDNSY